MAEPQETQQERETRWAGNRAKQQPQQQNRRATRANDRGRNWVVGVKRRWWALVEALRKRLLG
jgi:hypothetical protein